MTCPLFHYHPGLIAQAAATVDRLSGGRFALGVGTGEGINQRPLGFPFPGYKERAGRMTEAIAIIRALLAGEKLDFSGTYYRTDKARLYSPPRGRVPIWMSAGGPQSATLAGRIADGLILSVKVPAEAREQIIDPFRAAAQAAGRAAPTLVAQRWSILAADEDEGRGPPGPRGLGSRGGWRRSIPPCCGARRAMDRREIIGSTRRARRPEDLVHLPAAGRVGRFHVR